GRPGGVFLLRGEAILPAERTVLASVARGVLSGARGDLGSQLDRAAPEPGFRAEIAVREERGSEGRAPARPSLRFDNGIGGFTEDGREYVIGLGGSDETPLPWV